jgi:nickel/cobalt exporter
MTSEISALVATAATIGLFHTLLGPDHYLPFIAMSRSGKWSVRKTVLVTAICGIGHVLSSIVLGFVGIAMGIGVGKLEGIEAERGGLAAWALIAFGLAYFIWGIRAVWRNRPHEHNHPHEDGSTHVHTHTHSSGHGHLHARADSKNITPWALFLIFVLGPCEPLIPLLMYPAAKSSLVGVAWVAIVFSAVTVGTMLAVVVVSAYGMKRIPFAGLDRYSHAFAGGTILLCGVAIRFLGL